jgi:hypothetical protein
LLNELISLPIHVRGPKDGGVGKLIPEKNLLIFSVILHKNQTKVVKRVSSLCCSHRISFSRESILKLRKQLTQHFTLAEE